jgi:enoyl-CoA hydratase/carnithine racemase
VAGGCGLVAACDFVVAAADAKFGIPEVKLGLAPLIVMSVIQRVIGVRAATELAFFAELIGADRALELGLVNRVVELAEIEGIAGELIEKLLKLPAPALAATKRASYAISDTELSKLLVRLPKEVSVLSISEESLGLVAKFLDKGRK